LKGIGLSHNVENQVEINQERKMKNWIAVPLINGKDKTKDIRKETKIQH
jgi:hypothetical protein